MILIISVTGMVVIMAVMIMTIIMVISVVVIYNDDDNDDNNYQSRADYRYFGYLRYLVDTYSSIGFDASP